VGWTEQVAGVNAPPQAPVADAPHPLQVQAWRWKRDALRSQYPDCTDAQIERELARIYLRGNT
jgi:hypothetical protein